MTWQRLKECVIEYSKLGYDSNYSTYLKRIGSLKGGVKDELARGLVEFLNLWQCRLQYSRELRDGLLRALAKLNLLLPPLPKLELRKRI